MADRLRFTATSDSQSFSNVLHIGDQVISVSLASNIEQKEKLIGESIISQTNTNINRFRDFSSNSFISVFTTDSWCCTEGGNEWVGGVLIHTW